MNEIENSEQQNHVEKEEASKVEVWLIDNDDGQRMTLTDILSDANSELSGKLALQTFEKADDAFFVLKKRLGQQEKLPDIVLVDGLKNTTLTGVNFIKKAKDALPQNSKTKFIAFSTSDSSNESMKEAGAEDVNINKNGGPISLINYLKEQSPAK